MSDPEGLKIALRLIEQEAEQQTGFLDLGRLGLTSIPDELNALTHLKRLNLGSFYPTENAANRGASANQLNHNDFSGSGSLNIQLANLEMLSLIHTSVSDLSALSSLSSLQTLDCSGTSVSDLSVLVDVPNLKSLYANGCHLVDFPVGLLHHTRINALFLHNSSVTSVPNEVLSKHDYDNCLARLRDHFSDLATGSEQLPDSKLLIIGNGRIGKTQIARRLRGEEYNDQIVSTHGIVVTEANLPVEDDDDEILLNIWDFGGQDLYHGTHALFMKSRAVFAVVWTPQSETKKTYDYNGTTFRNQPLPYWLNYVQDATSSHGGSKATSPVVIIQNQCDTAEDEVTQLPPDDSDWSFYSQRVQYSAKLDRKRGTLNDALLAAVKSNSGSTQTLTETRARNNTAL
jgi:internalin A